MSKVLYIEDEAFLAKIVKESLERLGHEVIHQFDGKGIDRIYRDFAPDICLFDIMLPYKNGYELAKEIRQVDNKIPIIFLTAKSQTQDVVTGFEAGGNDYIKKPFSIEELEVRIQNLLRITTGSSKLEVKRKEVSIGKYYTFYPVKHQLKSESENRTLSHKESQILELLCNNINTTTDRKEILLKVWSDDSYFNSRNLDVYIRKLRGYLSQDDKVNIMTLKGVGYHFLVE